MAFFYGLVSQRGPFKETEIDFLRLTDPQFQLQVDPNTTNEVKTAKLRLQQRTSGRVGSRGDDRKFTSKMPINGVEKDLGLSQEMVNAVLQKVSTKEFLNGDGGINVTRMVAEMLPDFRKSQTYNYALKPMEEALRIRFEKTKDQMIDEDFYTLNLLINNVKYDTRTARNVITDSAKFAELQKTNTAEYAKTKVLSESSSRKETEKWLNGQYTIPNAQQQAAMASNLKTIKEDAIMTPPTPNLGLEGVQLNETIQEPTVPEMPMEVSENNDKKSETQMEMDVITEKLKKRADQKPKSRKKVKRKKESSDSGSRK